MRRFLWGIGSSWRRIYFVDEGNISSLVVGEDLFLGFVDFAWLRESISL